MAFKDHFSKQASQYTQFRPRYPDALFRFLGAHCPRRDRAWDCGTGGGQAAVDLAGYFAQVVATDPSESQIAHAQRHPKVEYLICSAEQCPLASDSVDLITVAQALHWFDFDRFYAQVGRVGRAGSILAAWSYGLATISPEVDRVVKYLYSDVLGSHWPAERKLIEEHYATIPFPFEELACPPFAMTSQWQLHDLIGYLGTWSALQQFERYHGFNPLEPLQNDLQRAWGGETVREIGWPLYLRVGRID